PPALDHIVARALAKDPEDRWQTARDLLLELRTRLGERPPVARSSSMPPIGWLLAGLVLLGVAGSGLLSSYFRRSAPAPLAVRAPSAPPGHMPFQLTGDFGGPPVVSPDGRAVAFAAVDPLGKRQIWIRHLDTLTPEALPGTDDGTFPFWSPDSRAIAFFASGQLKR